MERNACPYLGRPDDKNTSLAFPSEGNFCHKASPAAAVNRKHQADYCLTGQHAACPVFLARMAAPLPAALAAPRSRQDQMRKTLGKTILAGAVLLVYLASIWLGGPGVAGRLLSLAGPEIPLKFQLAGPYNKMTGVQTTAQQPEGTLQPESALAPAPTALPEDLQPEGPQIAAGCPFPQGWQSYTLKTSDSIFRLSVLFGISQEELLKANCLGSQVNLAPGAVLFVPATGMGSNRVIAYLPLIAAPVMAAAPAPAPQNDENEEEEQAVTAQEDKPDDPRPTEEKKGKNKDKEDEDKGKDDKKGKDDDKDDDKDEDDDEGDGGD